MFLYAFSLFELCTNLLKTEMLIITCQQSENKAQWCEDTEPEDNKNIPVQYEYNNKLKMGNKNECKHRNIETFCRLSTG